MKLDNFVNDAGYDSLLKFGGFDEAVIGIISRACREDVLLYDYEKMVEIKMRDDGLTREEAEEDLAYNTVCAYMGEQTPAVLVQKPEEKIDG